MTDLVAIVRATRAGANALAASHAAQQRMKHARGLAEFTRASVAYVRANERYARAQRVLAANPLPGDVVSGGGNV